MRDEKEVITHHEAAHAVAALMTVVGKLNGGVSATIVAGRGAGNAKINGWTSSEPVQGAFVFYAGPWAEARVQWQQPALEGLEDIDANGRSFRDTVRAAFMEGVGSTSDLACYNHMASIDPSIPERESDWSRELERAWEVIGTLAQKLRDGLEAAEPGPHPQPTLPGNDRLTMKQYEIAGDKVVALVQPLLEARGLWRFIR